MVVSKVKLSNRQWTYLKNYAPLWYKKIKDAMSIEDITLISFNNGKTLDMGLYYSCVSGELNAWTSGYRCDCEKCEYYADVMDECDTITEFGKKLTMLLVHDGIHRKGGDRDNAIND